jgi:AraC-like DNA-binding protein
MMHLWLNLFEKDVVGRLLEIKGGKIKTTGKQIVLSGAPTARLMSATWDELTVTSSLPHAFRRAKLLAVLSALCMRIVEYGFGKAEPHTQVNFQRQVIATIHRHIATTAGRDVPLAEAARLSGYSKYHFLRLFKQETGQTFHEYVNECRLKKVTAMQLERRTKTEIAEALGFSHLSTYLRWTKSSHLFNPGVRPLPVADEKSLQML